MLIADAFKLLRVILWIYPSPKSMLAAYENTGFPYLVIVIGQTIVSKTTGVSIEQFEVSTEMTYE